MTSLTPMRRPAPLDPARLDGRAQEALRDLLREGESQNTVASYRSALRYWEAWFELRYGQPLKAPVPPAVVIQFVLDHAERSNGKGRKSELPVALDRELVAMGCKRQLGSLSLATITHRLAVLAKLHQVRGHLNPCADVAVKELVLKTRRAYAKRSQAPRGKAALTKEPLEVMLATCDESLTGRRDRALLLFAWASGGRRRSEVTAATMENVSAADAGSYTYRLGASKSNQAGAIHPNDAKPIAGRAAEALKAWLAASGIREGAIFRRVRKGTTIGEPLSPAAVRDIVKRRAALAGLESGYSAHSLRSGFMTEAGRRRIPLGEAMALSGHASANSAMRYFRAGSVHNDRAARLLDDEADIG